MNGWVGDRQPLRSTSCLCLSAWFPAPASGTWEEEKETSRISRANGLETTATAPGLAGSPEHCGMLAGPQQGSEIGQKVQEAGSPRRRRRGWEDQRQSGQSHSADGHRGSGKSRFLQAVCVQGPVSPRCVMETHYTRCARACVCMQAVCTSGCITPWARRYATMSERVWESEAMWACVSCAQVGGRRGGSRRCHIF